MTESMGILAFQWVERSACGEGLTVQAAYTISGGVVAVFVIALFISWARRR